MEARRVWMKRSLGSARRRTDSEDQWKEEDKPAAAPEDAGDGVSGDREEVEEFNRLLLEKDLKRTKYVVEPHDEPSPSATVGRDVNNMDDLREASRQKYLGMRETQQLQILQSRLTTEEIFDQAALTEVERLRIESERRILGIAEQRKNATFTPQTYQMPEGTCDMVVRSVPM